MIRIYFRHTRGGWRAWRIGGLATNGRAFPIAHDRARRMIANGSARKVDAPPKGRGTKWLFG